MTGGPYLLDTSTIIWALAAPERLSSRAAKALRAGPRVLSVVSYWEVAIKTQKGLLKISDPVNWWTRATDLLGGTVLSVRSEHVTALVALPDLHRDPFDRLLISQASAQGFTLVTSDVAMQQYPVKCVW